MNTADQAAIAWNEGDMIYGDVWVGDVRSSIVLADIYADGSVCDEDFEPWSDWEEWACWFVSQGLHDKCQIAVGARSRAVLDLAAAVASRLSESGMEVIEIYTPFTN